MNRKPRRAFWIGIAVITLMGLCPPWMESYRYGAIRSIGYAWIFAPPKSLTAGIDVIRLLLQWVAVVIGVGIATAQQRSSNGDDRRGRGMSWRSIRLGALCLLLLTSAATAIIAQARWDDAVAVAALVLCLRFGILLVLQVNATPISGTADRQPFRGLV